MALQHQCWGCLTATVHYDSSAFFTRRWPGPDYVGHSRTHLGTLDVQRGHGLADCCIAHGVPWPYEGSTGRGLRRYGWCAKMQGLCRKRMNLQWQRWTDRLRAVNGLDDVVRYDLSPFCRKMEPASEAYLQLRCGCMGAQLPA